MSNKLQNSFVGAHDNYNLLCLHCPKPALTVVTIKLSHILIINVVAIAATDPTNCSLWGMACITTIDATLVLMVMLRF